MAKKNIKISKKTAILHMDEFHIVGCCMRKELIPNIIQDFYANCKFPLKRLIQAENYFKAIMGDEYKQENIEVYISSKEAPLLFCYKKQYDESSNDQIFMIAPRLEKVDSRNE